MSLLTLFLMLLTSFVVEVPISQFKALSKKGNMLLLMQLLWLECPLNEGSMFKRLMAGIDDRFVADIDVTDIC